MHVRLIFIYSTQLRQTDELRAVLAPKRCTNEVLIIIWRQVTPLDPLVPPLDVVNWRLTHLAAPVLQTRISVRRLDKHFPHVEERFMVWRVMDARGKLKEDVEKQKSS